LPLLKFQPSYLANSLANAVSEPDVYSLLTIHVPNVTVLYQYLGRNEIVFHVRGTCSCFVKKSMFKGEELSAPRPKPKQDDHQLSAVHDCLFNIFTAPLRTGRHSSIRNRRTRHAVVTGMCLSRNTEDYHC